MNNTAVNFLLNVKIGTTKSQNRETYRCTIFGIQPMKKALPMGVGIFRKLCRLLEEKITIQKWQRERQLLNENKKKRRSFYSILWVAGELFRRNQATFWAREFFPISRWLPTGKFITMKSRPQDLGHPPPGYKSWVIYVRAPLTNRGRHCYCKDCVKCAGSPL